MKKILMMSFTVALLMLFTLQSQAQSTLGSPAVPPVKTSAPAVASPEKTTQPATPDQPAGTDTKKSVQPRKFGPGITKIPKSEATESLGVSSVRMLIAMVVVIAAMGVFFWGLKKLNSRLNTFDKASAIKVKSRVQLDSKNAVVLVGIYEQEFLIGSGTNGVTLISKFSSIEDTSGLNEAEIPTEEVNDAKPDIKGASFGDKLLKLGAAPVESSSLNKINGGNDK